MAACLRPTVMPAKVIRPNRRPRPPQSSFILSNVLALWSRPQFLRTEEATITNRERTRPTCISHSTVWIILMRPQQPPTVYWRPARRLVPTGTVKKSKWPKLATLKMLHWKGEFNHSFLLLIFSYRCSTTVELPNILYMCSSLLLKMYIFKSLNRIKNGG